MKTIRAQNVFVGALLAFVAWDQLGFARLSASSSPSWTSETRTPRSGAAKLNTFRR